MLLDDDGEELVRAGDPRKLREIAERVEAAAHETDDDGRQGLLGWLFG